MTDWLQIAEEIVYPDTDQYPFLTDTVEGILEATEMDWGEEL